MDSTLDTRREQRALIKVDGLLFSDSDIDYYEKVTRAWPSKPHIVRNSISRAWEELQAVVMDTRLVALLHREGSNTSENGELNKLRMGVSELLGKMKKMLLNGGTQDPRTEKFKAAIRTWEASLLFTGTKMPSDGEVIQRLKDSIDTIKELIREREEQAPLGCELATSFAAEEERKFKANMGDASPSDMLRFQRIGAERWARQLDDLERRVEIAQKKNGALLALKAVLLQLERPRTSELPALTQAHSPPSVVKSS